jgi:serine/threonine protein kinase
LLTADQRTVKLVDLGLAREETLTEMMTAETGTYRWMAPEVSTVAVSYLSVTGSFLLYIIFH